MTDWPVMTLQKAGVALIDCVHKTPAPVEVGFPYVAIPQMKNGRIDFTDARRISHSDFQEWTKKARPKLHDVILSRRTNPGVTATFGSECDFALGQNLVLLRADGTFVCPEFLRWLLVSPEWWDQIRKFNNVGAVFDSLRCADVPRFELPIPPKHHQRAIASILAALDDKIQLNRKMNQTLETMARATFKDWFVDFGPTRAKSEGIAPYLAIAVWDQFPGSFDGEGRPQNWRPATLSAIANLNPESWSAQSRPSQVEYVDLANTKWGTIETTEIHSWDAAPSRARRVLRPGDTIVGTVRPGNGSYAFVDQDGLTGSTGFAVLRPKSRAYRELIYCAATSSENIEHLSHLADGAAYPAVRPDVVANTAIVLGVPSVIDAFSAMCAPLIDRCEANKRESKTLALARDLLLPKLISGEVQVRDAEKMAEAVL